MIARKVKKLVAQCRGGIILRSLVLTVIAMLALTLGSLSAWAQVGQGQNNLLDDRDQNQEARTRISKRQASELAQKNYDGRVLNVRLEGDQWRVRMDEDGKVFNVFVHAQTGKVSRPD